LSFAVSPQGRAIVTPSYAGDAARCDLLCASIDRHVSGLDCHYILVEDADLPLFRHLEAPHRRVVPDSALLPSWLRPIRDPLQSGRRVWLGLRMGVPLWPMRGWHVQQLRKLAIARHAREEVMLHCDSDVIFVKPFDMNSLVCADGRVRLYRIDDGIRADIPQRGHAAWLAAAATLLGLPVSSQPTADYINNLITWRRSHVLALLDHVETVSGRNWVSAIGRHRSFSEALIYGQFVDRVLGEGSGHVAESLPLCRTWWFGDRTDEASILDFVAGLEPRQVAIGLQSFIEAPLEVLQRLIEASSTAQQSAA
jgi:hypothetical protein